MIGVLLVCICLSTPHVLYYWVWTRSHQFQKLCTSNGWGEPLTVFTNLAKALKVWQALVFGIWYLSDRKSTTTTTDLFSLPNVVLGSILLVLGQTLNIGIYNAIGKVGVYYGCRLGHTVPWCTGFPFTICRNPQYVGSVLSIWGVTLIIWKNGPPSPRLLLLHNDNDDEQDKNVDLFLISFFLTLCYAFSSYVEECW